MIVGVLKETYPGEKRVALIPAVAAQLAKGGLEIQIEAGAGLESGFTDAAFTDKGAKVVSRADVLRGADVVLQVRGFGSNRDAGRADLTGFRAGQVVIAMLDPLNAPDAARELAACGVTSFALELVPRITRAQSMDVLSSMATVSGYKAVVLAATHHVRMFPMLTTAAGTITPARVFIIGAGVAGLQAIASARKLGAVVEAYDVRPAVKEQVQSLGGKFVELPLATAGAEGAGGYAKAQDEEFYNRQRELMARVVTQSDVVICTAAVPGRKAPILITREMVEAMAPGSVVVDIAAERGGNCELTRPAETIVHNGVTIVGPVNVPSDLPYHASQMFAANITAFLKHIVRNGALALNLEDEIIRETLVTHGSKVVHPRIAELLDLSPAALS